MDLEQVSALLLIKRYQHFKFSKMFICVANMSLNYDLYLMLTAPFKRNISSTVKKVFLISVPFFILLVILSNSALMEALKIPGRIKLRLEDTIDNIIFPKVIVW